MEVVDYVNSPTFKRRLQDIGDIKHDTFFNFKLVSPFSHQLLSSFEKMIEKETQHRANLTEMYHQSVLHLFKFIILYSSVQLSKVIR